MRPIDPITICHLVGHSRERYMAGYYFDRRGRQRERWHSRCKRCGTSDGGEVFREGALERFTWRRFQSWKYNMRRRTGLWWRDTCDDCKQPTRRFGRPVGSHDNCNPIPF